MNSAWQEEKVASALLQQDTFSAKKVVYFFEAGADGTFCTA
jgi:hypothetical protein